jgi:hypothetical protein
VSDGLARILRSAKEDGVRTGWGSHCEFVDGQTLTASLDDACAGSASEAEGGNTHLRDFEETENDS